MMAQRIFDYTKLYFSLFLTGCLFVALDTGSVVMSLLLKDGPKKRRITRSWLLFIARLCCKILQRTGILSLDVAQFQKIARQRRDTIFIANHPSRLDTVILAAYLPDMVCITKPSIWRKNVLGPTLRRCGYICFGKILNIIGPAKQALREGCPLFVFPEGTRSGPLGRPEKIFSGFAALALGTRAHIQVLYITTDSPYLSQGWFYLKCPHKLPMSYQIEVGPCLAPPYDEKEGRALMQQIETLYKEHGTVSEQ